MFLVGDVNIVNVLLFMRACGNKLAVYRTVLWVFDDLLSLKTEIFCQKKCWDGAIRIVTHRPTCDVIASFKQILLFGKQFCVIDGWPDGSGDAWNAESRVLSHGNRHRIQDGLFALYDQRG